MKLFKCQHCDLVIFFENRNCSRCGHTLGFIPMEIEFSALEADNGLWSAPAFAGNQYKFCENAQYDACNWLIPAHYSDRFCIACRHNRTVPDLSDLHNLENWRKMEFAKHRLFYTLLKLKLPLSNRADDPQKGLVFDFLSEAATPDHKVITGHDDGIITLALSEADDVEREARRTALHEPYRTLLGHFRHEIGHYYWDRLVSESSYLEECRAIFGDESTDYSEALKRHYDQGPPSNWQDNFVSAYATSHPWEDFAETWAHYLHIVDSLDTSHSFGIQVHPAITQDPELHTNTSIDPYQAGGFEALIKNWLPLTYAMNSMNRSMGLQDIYPFVLSPEVIRKLGFMHKLVHGTR